MNRNAVIFVAASLAVLLLWNYVLGRYPSPAQTSAATAPRGAMAASSGSPAAVGPVATVAPAAVPAPADHAAPEQKVRVSTADFEAELSSQGAQFTSLRLKNVRSMKADGGILDLVPPGELSLYGTIQLDGTGLDSMAWTLLTPKPVAHADGQAVVFAARLPRTSLEFTKTFVFAPSGHRVQVLVGVRNVGNQAQKLLAPLAFTWGPFLGGNSGGFYRGRVQRSAVVQLADRIERERSGKEVRTLDYDAPRWLALKNQYFVVGLFPAAGSGWTQGEVRDLGPGGMVVALRGGELSLAPGASATYGLSLWAGPQEYGTLKAVGDNFQGVVQFQFYSWLEWLNPLCVVLLYVLKWFYALTGNWGVAIILLTILVRGALFYPSMKSMVKMRHMQLKQAVLKPRLETLKKTYKDNPQKLNEETLKLYREFGVNPLGGCLPMLVQIPIIFSLYDTLAAAYELRGASFVWRWTDLSAADPTYLFPLAMGVSMFLQQRLTPVAESATEEQQQMQKMMLWMMPVMFTGMALYMKWPMGLLLYWTASNLMGILQQLVVNRMVD